MASKFQNRLVGTVILVALGVIILPGLLDGKKKHYEDEFAAIPLVPKAGDVEENDVLPPVSQPLPAQPPEGAGALVEQQAANEAAAQQAVSPADAAADVGYAAAGRNPSTADATAKTETGRGEAKTGAAAEAGGSEAGGET